MEAYKSFIFNILYLLSINLLVLQQRLMKRRQQPNKQTKLLSKIQKSLSVAIAKSKVKRYITKYLWLLICIKQIIIIPMPWLLFWAFKECSAIVKAWDENWNSIWAKSACLRYFSLNLWSNFSCWCHCKESSSSAQQQNLWVKKQFYTNDKSL